MRATKCVVHAVAIGLSLLSTTFSASAQAGRSFEERFASLIAAARAEGELTWYQSSLEAAGRDFAVHFQSRFGIKTTQTYLVGTPNLERFRSESRAGHHIADVFSISDGTLMLPALAEGLLVNYRTASNDAFPKNWLLESNGVTVYPTGRVQMAIAYNTQAVKADEVKKLADWSGLTDPAFRNDRFSLADATRVGAVYPTYLYLLRMNKDQYGRSFLDKVAAQKPVIFGNMTEQVSRMAAGEIDVGLMVDLVAIQQYNRKAPIAWQYPKPTPVTLHYSGVSKNAPHPNAARLFLEYLTSDEGTVEWAKAWNAPTGRPDIDQKTPAPYAKESWYKAPTEFFEIKDWAAAEREQKGVIQEWSEIFRK
jgi:iron(III) transport system substrate-binding protein